MRPLAGILFLRNPKEIINIISDDGKKTYVFYKSYRNHTKHRVPVLFSYNNRGCHSVEAASRTRGLGCALYLRFPFGLDIEIGYLKFL